MDLAGYEANKRARGIGLSPHARKGLLQHQEHQDFALPAAQRL